MKLSSHFIFLFVFLCFTNSSFAQNPIIKNIGMSDPHARVFNDTLFLFTGHDTHPDDKTWVMKEWQIFSTTDLVNWEKRGVISPTDNYMDNNSTDCWAADASTRNGNYYFYFSDRKRGVGVMSSDSPTGPYKDALGKALVSPMHDPTIIINDDKNKIPYLLYGDKEGGGFHIARLNEDMISLAEQPKPIEIKGKEWEAAPQWMDKSYIFKHKENYYLSWGRDYAISKNIYGPYDCAGAVGFGFDLSEYAHGSFFWWKGQFYHIWCYYIRPGYKYRESIITYCHFTDEGKIITDTNFLDNHFETGVGQYKANWEKIEAEWFYEISPNIIKQESSDGGFELSGLSNKSWVRFANVSFDKTANSFSAKVMVKDKGKMEIRLGSPKGKKIGSIRLKKMTTIQNITTELVPFIGKDDIYLIFKGKNVDANLDWFCFN